MIELPAILMTQGIAGTYEFTWATMDLSDWTGTVTFRENWADDALFTVTPVMDANGNVVITWTAAQASLMPAKDKPGFFKTGLFQAALTGTNEAETFQGFVMVAGAAA